MPYKNTSISEAYKHDVRDLKQDRHLESGIWHLAEVVSASHCLGSRELSEAATPHHDHPFRFFYRLSLVVKLLNADARRER